MQFSFEKDEFESLKFL